MIWVIIGALGCYMCYSVGGRMHTLGVEIYLRYQRTIIGAIGVRAVTRGMPIHV